MCYPHRPPKEISKTNIAIISKEANIARIDKRSTVNAFSINV